MGAERVFVFQGLRAIFLHTEEGETRRNLLRRGTLRKVMNTFNKILLVGIVALGGMGSLSTASAYGHGHWYGGYGWHGGSGWHGGYYRSPRVVIYPSPVYQYAPFYSPYYSYGYPYYGSSVVVIRGGHHHHHHH